MPWWRNCLSILCKGCELQKKVESSANHLFLIISEAFSAIIIVGAFVFPEVTTGIIEASTWNMPRPSKRSLNIKNPCTNHSKSVDAVDSKLRIDNGLRIDSHPHGSCLVVLRTCVMTYGALPILVAAEFQVFASFCGSFVQAKTVAFQGAGFCQTNSETDAVYKGCYIVRVCQVPGRSKRSFEKNLKGRNYCLNACFLYL